MSEQEIIQPEEDLGKQMSFLEHLDEFRRRLINSIIVVVLAFGVCWFFLSTGIYNFLSVPVIRAMGEAQRREVPVEGLTGSEKVIPLAGNLPEGATTRYIFDHATKLGVSVVSPGTSVDSIVAKDGTGRLGLYTNESICASNAIIPKGIKLPVDLNAPVANEPSADQQLVVTTVPEKFTLLVTVSLYAAIAISIPFLLWQIWGFISPALYKHERAYVTPFIGLSTIAFVIGAAFAYYIIVPPALTYLLGLGEDFRLMLRASDYLDFITIVLLAMGIIFQMPAITYVLASIGLVSAGFLVKNWKYATVIILIVAAIVSPTGDIPNMLLFAAPMLVLYVVSIFVAWVFGKKRNSRLSAV